MSSKSDPLKEARKRIAERVADSYYGPWNIEQEWLKLAREKADKQPLGAEAGQLEDFLIHQIYAEEAQCRTVADLALEWHDSHRGPRESADLAAAVERLKVLREE